MVEVIRNMTLLVLQIFIKTSQTDVYTHLLHHVDNIFTLEEAVLIARRYEASKDKTIVNIFGYKKPHPLEDKILFIVSLNPTHKLVVGDEITKIQNMFTYLLDGIDDLVSDLRILSKLADQTF